jgi:hypothetical protein
VSISDSFFRQHILDASCPLLIPELTIPLFLSICIICGLRIYYLSDISAALPAPASRSSKFSTATPLLSFNMYQVADQSRVADIYRSMFWSTLEITIAFLCACLPTLGPLVPKGRVGVLLSRWCSSVCCCWRKRVENLSFLKTVTDSVKKESCGFEHVEDGSSPLGAHCGLHGIAIDSDEDSAVGIIRV